MNRSQILRTAVSAAVRSTEEAFHKAGGYKNALLLNEQWCQSYVGIAVQQAQQNQFGTDDEAYVTFETSVRWIEKYTGARSPGPKPGNLTDRQRFDILVWSKGGSPAGVIEIKDDPVMQSYACQSDPQKIEAALKRWSELRWGIFLFSVRTRIASIHPMVVNKLDKKRDNVFEQARRAVKCQTVEAHSVRVRNESMMWCGMVFIR